MNLMVRFEGPLLKATFEDRPNRFLGTVRVDDRRVSCYIPNPGRMEELLIPGTEVYLSEKAPVHRKTSYDLVLVKKGGTLVSIDSRIPNKFMAEFIEKGLIREFDGYGIGRQEYTFGDSRLDFLLTQGAEKMFLEVKSCTLVVGGVALFPDAPTKRGSRHLRALISGLAQGRASVAFVIQRDDASTLRPNEATDPVFAETIREAERKGVEVYAYSSNVTLEGITIKKRVQVNL